ncbi:uncharacterized protein DS421_6g187220 [Arachis hypogaea]|nr:uncharacterized protein DS421_6g187220 [Arachis hypogaea]
MSLQVPPHYFRSPILSPLKAGKSLILLWTCTNEVLYIGTICGNSPSLGSMIEEFEERSSSHHYELDLINPKYELQNDIRPPTCGRITSTIPVQPIPDRQQSREDDCQSGEARVTAGLREKAIQIIQELYQKVTIESPTID